MTTRVRAAIGVMKRHQQADCGRRQRPHRGRATSGRGDTFRRVAGASRSARASLSISRSRIGFVTGG